MEEGLHTVGRVTGVIDPDSLVARRLQAGELSSLGGKDIPYFYGDAIAYTVEKGRLTSISPDISGVRDVLIAEMEDGSFLVGDDFFETVRHMPRVHLDHAAAAFFTGHGYFDTGRTFFREIRRVPTGKRAVFSPLGRPSFESLFAGIPPGGRGARMSDPYEAFKECLLSVFTVEEVADEELLLLSGGCDSGLIAAIMTKVLGARPQTATMEYVPYLEGNVSDARIAGGVSGHLGLEHAQYEVNFDGMQLERLRDFVRLMPLAAHFSLNHDHLARATARSGAGRVWSGQNADSIYNLGPTARFWPAGKGDLIKRFFLSRDFMALLSDVHRPAPRLPAAGLLARLGRLLISHRFSRSYTLPENFNEFLASYQASERYLPLKEDASFSLPPLQAAITTGEARERIFDEKLSSFLVGRDARVMPAAAALNGIRAKQPYSSPNMIHFFRSLEMGWRDVISPKRFFYRYLRELLGSSACRQLFNGGDGGKGVRDEPWQKMVLHETRIGKDLMSQAGADRLTSPGKTAAALQPFVSLYWSSSVMEEVAAAGTEILDP